MSVMSLHVRVGDVRREGGAASHGTLRRDGYAKDGPGFLDLVIW
jgi:hypothetical protein